MVLRKKEAVFICKNSDADKLLRIMWIR